MKQKKIIFLQQVSIPKQLKENNFNWGRPHAHQTSLPFERCTKTTLCSQCANNGGIRKVFTADLSQLDMICISSEVLTEDSPPGNPAICMHL